MKCFIRVLLFILAFSYFDSTASGQTRPHWFDINRSPKVYDITTYGADTASNDNSLAIQRAFDASGGHILVPKGTFKFSTPIVLKSYQGVAGTAYISSRLEYTGTGAAVLFDGVTSPVRQSYFVNCSLVYANKSENNPVGIHLSGQVTRILLDNVEVLGARNPNLAEQLVGTGILLDAKGGGSVWGITIRCPYVRLWGTGIKFSSEMADYAGATLILGQGEIQNNNYGIIIGEGTFTGGSKNSVRDLVIQGNYVGGIWIKSQTNSIVDSCWFESNGDYDIRIGSYSSSIPTNVVVSNNLLGSAGSHKKIWIDQGNYVKTEHNRIARNTGVGIYISEASAASSSKLILGHDVVGDSADYDVPLNSPNIIFANGRIVPWFNIDLSTSSATAAVGRQYPQYKMVTTSDDFGRHVELRGVLDIASCTARPALLFTLPEGYRPVTRVDLLWLGGYGYITSSGDVFLGNTLDIGDNTLSINCTFSL